MATERDRAGDGPDILALDFDGVLCDGMGEYFETSRRTYARAWPGAPAPGDGELSAFRRLRPVIMNGWEMPVLLRAMALGRSEDEIATRWERTRDGIVEVEDGGPGGTLVGRLGRTLDDVRREWIAADPDGWLAHHVPYCPLEDLRRLVAQPEQALVVTTKEGEFARRILDHWGIALAGISGKEGGHAQVRDAPGPDRAYAAARGRRPRLWFVEDRLETLQHVTEHRDLDDVGLFLAAWGYNTPAARAVASADPRIRLLELPRLRQRLGAWG